MKVYIVISEDNIPYEGVITTVHGVRSSIDKAEKYCKKLAPSVYDGKWTVMTDGGYPRFDNTKFLMQTNTTGKAFVQTSLSLC